MSASMPMRTGFFLVYWAASFCLWLLFVNTTREHELWLAAAASVIAAAGAEVARAHPFADFSPRVVWRTRWFNPVTGHEERQTGRRAGDEIVQVGARPDGTTTRWRFAEITPDSFRWMGEALEPDGKTWKLGR